MFGRAGKTGLQVVDKDPANLSILELIVVLGLRNRWGDMLLDPLEIMTCNYPYRTAGYHYLGHYLTQQRDMPRALDVFRIMAIADPESGEAEYDLACTLGALDRKDEAFAHLRRAIDLGAHDFEHMRRDARLVPLRGDPRFTGMIPASGG
jgi:tetratricopeptide (TPR) repeat protein